MNKKLGLFKPLTIVAIVLLIILNLTLISTLQDLEEKQNINRTSTLADTSRLADSINSNAQIVDALYEHLNLIHHYNDDLPHWEVHKVLPYKQ